MGDFFFNIGNKLNQVARAIPNSPAIIEPCRKNYKQTNFLKLDHETNQLVSSLAKAGIKRGHRVILMVRPGLEFISLSFALFRLGAVPVLIDPGLGRKSFLSCLHAVEPDGMIAIPLAHIMRILFAKSFKTIQIFITVGKRWFWGGKTLDQLKVIDNKNFHPAQTKPDETAAILFTSGSTGPPKGVIYTHKMFSEQANILQTCYGLEKGEVDLPTFPLFALLSISMGMTCVIPEMNPSKPIKANPQKILAAIKRFNVTTSFGSPALWDIISRHCLEHDIQLPSLKRILIAGAPVPGNLLRRFDSILKDGEVAVLKKI